MKYYEIRNQNGNYTKTYYSKQRMSIYELLSGSQRLPYQIRTIEEKFTSLKSCANIIANMLTV